ncbi:hypothetical protein ACFLXB_06910 [Chloroflexota bacterium]
MNKQKIGKMLFWFGAICTIVWLALTMIQSPIHRVHTAEELSGTIHAVWGPLFWIRIMGGSGLTFSLIGALLYSGKKGSYFWLLGFLPNFLNFGQYWQPSLHKPWLFGIGGAIIIFSYFGLLWLWIRTHAFYDGVVRTGKQVQILGYSFLVVTSLLMCMHFGNPKQLALADLAVPSGEIINLSLALSMFVLFLGHYLVSKGSKSEIESL